MVRFTKSERRGQITNFRNPAFLFKMAMLVAGVLNVAAFHWYFRSAIKKEEPLLRPAPFMAAVSLAS
jgi:hypothetical protein